MDVYNDFDTTVKAALQEIDINWRRYPGLVICGTHTPVDPEGLIRKIKYARLKRLPFLGICFGHQLAAIEHARNVLGIKNATSEEFGQGLLIVKKRPEGLKVGLHEGESFWNNFEVDENLLNLRGGWEKPENFFTTQSHPEYQSSRAKPHPFLIEFLNYAKRLAM